MLVMDQNIEQRCKAYVKVPMGKETNNGEVSCQATQLREHFVIHSGEKSNKGNQCDYASSRAGHLRKHLKMHSGEKPNKCNQCDYASSEAGKLRRHLKKHSGAMSNKLKL